MTCLISTAPHAPASDASAPAPTYAPMPWHLKLVLGRHVASFVEIYGPRRPVADIPKLTVSYGNLRVNGVVVQGVTAKAIYPKGVPDYANVSAKGSGVEIAIGKPISDRRQREVEVHSK
jgi:hypothetical protein